MTWIIGIIVAVLAAVAVMVFAWWSLGIIAAAALVLAVVLLFSRSAARTVERAHKPPTAAPGKVRGGAETANERVGQG
jgi:membrane protein implicated in regulation of membrane protease activity